MSLSSKKILANLITGTITVIAYIIVATSTRAPESANLRGWAVMMLVFIGAGIAGIVVAQIVFHFITVIGVAVKSKIDTDNDIERAIESSLVEDEMTRLIDMKASRIGYSCAGIGFVAALIAIVVGSSVILSLHIVFGAFALGSIVEGLSASTIMK